MDGQMLEEVLQFFGRDISGARAKYRQFIADGLATGHRDDLIGGGLRRRKAIKDDSAERDHFDPRVLGSRVFREDGEGNYSPETPDFIRPRVI